MIDRSSSFQFNQSNLQNFSGCRRRFYLRDIQQLAWPAAEAEPIMENEKWMRQGTAFHKIVHQYLLGVPEDLLTRQAVSEPLQTWWANFLNHKQALPGLDDTQSQRRPEYMLSAHFGKFMVSAKYDLLVLTPDSSIIIYDWKTSRHKPKRATLENRLQTLIYPLVAAACCPELLGTTAASPPHITMQYWFAGVPEKPEVFVFDQPLLEENRQKLETLMDTVTRLLPLGAESFPLTPNQEKCTYCSYRSLCDRGLHAGPFLDAGEEGESPEFVLDLEQIGEVEY